MALTVSCTVSCTVDVARRVVTFTWFPEDIWLKITVLERSRRDNQETQIIQKWGGHGIRGARDGEGIHTGVLDEDGGEVDDAAPAVPEAFLTSCIYPNVPSPPQISSGNPGQGLLHLEVDT